MKRSPAKRASSIRAATRQLGGGAVNGLAALGHREESSAVGAGVKQRGARAKPATGEGPAGMPQDRP